MPASFETCFETLPNKKGGKRGKEIGVGRHLSELLAFAFPASQKSSPCEDYKCSSLDKTSASYLNDVPTSFPKLCNVIKIDFLDILVDRTW